MFRIQVGAAPVPWHHCVQSTAISPSVGNSSSHPANGPTQDLRRWCAAMRRYLPDRSPREQLTSALWTSTRARSGAGVPPPGAAHALEHAEFVAEGGEGGGVVGHVLSLVAGDAEGVVQADDLRQLPRGSSRSPGCYRPFQPEQSRRRRARVVAAHEPAICRYFAARVTVKTRRGLTVTQAEQEVLTARAADCPNVPITTQPVVCVRRQRPGRWLNG